MKVENLKFKILYFLISSFFILGCEQSHYSLNDQASKQTLGPEYTDFADLPLPEISEDQTQDPVLEAPIKKDAEQQEVAIKNEPVKQQPNEVAQPDNTVKPPQAQASQPSPQPQADLVPGPLLKKTGAGIGTVYYLPVYGEKRNCRNDELSNMKDESEKTIVQLCKDEVWNCAMQGSCFYLDKEGVSLLAYKKMVKIEVPETKKIISQPRFRLNKELMLCPQGMGAHRVCLDPYRSIAADPKFHKIGDVIYVPLLKGKKLPNNETHDGYLVVRDTGGNIKGEGRFDFFIGFDSYRGHLFSQLGLADKKSGPFTYHLVPEEISKKVRLARAFPMAPRRVHENARVQMMKVIGLGQSTTRSQLAESQVFYLNKLKSDF